MKRYDELKIIKFSHIFKVSSLIIILLIITIIILRYPNKNSELFVSLCISDFIILYCIVCVLQVCYKHYKEVKYLRKLINNNTYISFNSWTDKIINYVIGTHKNNFIPNKCRAYITYKNGDNQEYWFASPVWDSYNYPYQVGGTFKVYVDLKENPYIYYMQYNPPKEYLDADNNLVIYSKSLKYKCLKSLKRVVIYFACILGFLVSLLLFRENCILAFIFVVPILINLIRYYLYKKQIHILLSSTEPIIVNLVHTNNNQENLASAIYNYKDLNGNNYNFRVTHIDAALDINKLLKHEYIASSDILQNTIVGFPKKLEIYFKKDNPYIFYID